MRDDPLFEHFFGSLPRERGEGAPGKAATGENAKGRGNIMTNESASRPRLSRGGNHA